MNTKKRIIFTIPVLIITSIIFILSHQPHPPIPEIEFVLSDKILHLFAYFIFGCTIIAALIANFPNLSIKKLIVLVLIIGSIYGVSDEFHQSFVPGRDVSFFDWLADFTGTALSLLLVKTIKKFIN